MNWDANGLAQVKGFRGEIETSISSLILETNLVPMPGFNSLVELKYSIN